jgi:hypothetical protein
MITAMTYPSSRWSDQWPFKGAMQMPIVEDPLKLEQKIHRSLCKRKFNRVGEIGRA